MKNLLLLTALLFGIKANAQCTLSASFTYYESGGNIYFTNTSTNEPLYPNYDWWFDTQSSSVENPVFSTSGLYGWQWVCLMVYDSTWTCVDSVCANVFIDSSGTTCNLTADFTYYESGGNLYLTNASTNEPTGANYDWWYGSQSSNMENPVFSTAGLTGWQTVCLIVYDATWSCVDSICSDVYIDTVSTGCNVTADFTYYESGGNLYLTNTSTNEPLGVNYDWWFGAQNSSAENPVFSTAGLTGYQTICLTVFDSTWSCYDSTCTTVFIDSTGSCNLNVAFTYTSFGGSIYFTDQSTNVPTDASYDWWYGAQNSTLANPVFTANNGYTMTCLTVHNASWTCYDSVCVQVFVDSTADTTVTTMEFEEEPTFTFYPNPASDVIFIETASGNSNSQVLITDPSGRLVKQVVINEEGTIGMDIYDLPEGLYFITVFNMENPEIRTTEKFIKRN